MAEPRAIVEQVRGCANTTGSEIAIALLVAIDAASSAQPPAVKLPAAQGDACYGATMEAIANNGRGDVQVRGVAKVTAGAAVAVGAEVMATTAGKAITATSGEFVAGRALTAAAADADVIEVELADPGGSKVVP